MKPNIFDYGTSELSNNTIIYWILKWSEVTDSKLYDLSKDLIQLFVEDYSKNIEINEIELYKDFIYERSIFKKHIDILIKLNDEYIIIIGDNVDSGVDINKQNDYRYILEKDKAFSDKTIIYIYLKIEEEPTFNIIGENGYKIIKRINLINIIEKYKDTANEILKDYYNYLCKIDSEYNSYSNIELINNWESRSWQGFYSNLQEEKKMNNECWYYVNNRKGGFWLFLWNENKLKYNMEIDYSIYLQIAARNEPRIDFKVEVDNAKYQSKIRDFVWRSLEEIINSTTEKKYIPKKSTFKKGKRMVIAHIYNIETENDIKKAMSVAEYYYSEFIKILEKNNMEK